MGRWGVVVIAIAGTVLAPACGATTSTGTTGSEGPNGSGGASGAGGSSGAAGAAECRTGADCSYPLICLVCPDGTDSCPAGADCVRGQCIIDFTHECAPASESGGTSAAGGTGGTNVDGGTASPGKVSIEFTVDPSETYCRTFTCSGNLIEVKDASGSLLMDVSDDCSLLDCDTCERQCMLHSCITPFGLAVTGATRDWDGLYTVPSVCGPDRRACVQHLYVGPGKYVATMCATPGFLSGPRTDPAGTGDEDCYQTGPARCTEVPFEFPSDTVVRGTIGP